MRSVSQEMMGIVEETIGALARAALDRDAIIVEHRVRREPSDASRRATTHQRRSGDHFDARSVRKAEEGASLLAETGYWSATDHRAPMPTAKGSLQ